MDLFELQRSAFRHRHIGPDEADTQSILKTVGVESPAALMELTVPPDIRLPQEPDLPIAESEYQYLQNLKKKAGRNKLFKTYIGQGYYDTITPSVIQRNVFENPGWYTQYTPYQAEISQGRLECLLNFQTMVSDLTGLPIANAGLLDEATAAAEAMHLVYGMKNKRTPTAAHFFVDEKTFAQTKEVLRARAEPLAIHLEFGDFRETELSTEFCGALLQYPNSEGAVPDYREFTAMARAKQIPVIMATDLLALCLLEAPGKLGADIAVGSAQRFGVPLGYGGPHSAFFAAKETYKRLIPGRIIGISEDAAGKSALRMALQTREQHIRREKATSNICTAQALLANMAALYAVYHGPEGLKQIAQRITLLAGALSKTLEERGFQQENEHYFDTLKIKVEDTVALVALKEKAEQAGINFYYGNGYTGIALDETTSIDDLAAIIRVFTRTDEKGTLEKYLNEDAAPSLPTSLIRKSPFLTHPVFHAFHSETRMMRYLKKLENKDLALDRSMIPLGSCTMKLNAASELIPLSWPEFSRLHPYVPKKQAEGYEMVLQELSDMLCSITGLAACSLQPNSGAQGEFTGLMTIRAYHKDRGEENRNVVIIPISAHGTNPASAVMAGMKVVVVKCDEKGSIDVNDLREKAEAHKENLAAVMVTYPSTYGVFELAIREICRIVHENGGLVYLDGANMNAQAGYTSPGHIGADVCHLNLHKTFAIPHGGGGPGAGPICVNDKLKPYLPGNPTEENAKGKHIHAVSAAAYGSASILLISYGYLKMLGAAGLKKATEFAVLNANYMKTRLEPYYPILYSGHNHTCAHEFIIDLRTFKAFGIEAEDVAKRLMDYGFHAPTLSFPVPGTLMTEPTESEDKKELDRFCDALIAIRKEIESIEKGQADPKDNLLKNAPHTQEMVISDKWDHPYSRQEAVFPLDFIRDHKFWPAVSRVNNTLGDRNLICTCEPVEAYV